MMPAKISGVFACAYNHLYNLDQQLLPEALEDPVSVTLVCGCAAGWFAQKESLTEFSALKRCLETRIAPIWSLKLHTKCTHRPPKRAKKYQLTTARVLIGPVRARWRLRQLMHTDRRVIGITEEELRSNGLDRMSFYDSSHATRKRYLAFVLGPAFNLTFNWTGYAFDKQYAKATGRYKVSGNVKSLKQVRKFLFSFNIHDSPINYIIFQPSPVHSHQRTTTCCHTPFSSPQNKYHYRILLVFGS